MTSTLEADAGKLLPYFPMQNDDPRSLNLFSRLSHYVPSEGEKQVRRPLEDFCTEALAFCLVKSVTFKNKFVFELLHIPDSSECHFLVDTQKTIRDCSIINGRADLALEIVSDNQRDPIYVEVKIGASTRDSQKHYAHFILAPQAYFSRFPKEWPPEKEISWESVHRILIDSLSNETLAQDDPLRFVMKQFAEFLAEKGLKCIIMKTDAYAINGITSTASLLNEWTELLNSLRNNLGLKMRGNPPPKWDIPNVPRGDSFYGITGNKWRYAGFEITPSGKISCYYEEPFFGDMPTEFGQFDVGPGDPGTVFITARKDYPTGSEDKASEVQQIFSGLQQELRNFASKNKLKPCAPLNSDSDQE